MSTVFRWGFQGRTSAVFASRWVRKLWVLALFPSIENRVDFVFPSRCKSCGKDGGSRSDCLGVISERRASVQH